MDIALVTSHPGTQLLIVVGVCFASGLIAGSLAFFGSWLHRLFFRRHK